jgi:hypothetical protein
MVMAKKKFGRYDDRDDGLFIGVDQVRNRESVEDLDAKKIADSLDAYEVKFLTHLYWAVTGKTAPSESRKALCKVLGSLLNFRSQEQFDQFFASFPPCAQDAIRIGTYYRYVLVDSIEKKHNISLLEKIKEKYYYQELDAIKQESRMTLFSLLSPKILYLPAELRSAFKPWIPLPEGTVPKPIENPEGVPWSNAEAIDEILPLFFDAIGPLFENDTIFEIARKGLLKTGLRTIRTACGQKEFPIASRYGLDSIELLTRFIALMETKAPKRPSDAGEYVKNLVKRFFSLLKTRSGNTADYSGFLEAVTLVDHLKYLQSGTYTSDTQFGFRATLLKVLREISVSGNWFAVSVLCRAEFMQDRLIDEDADDFIRNMYLKGEKLSIDDTVITLSSYQKGIVPMNEMQYPLFEEPLFKAYLYLMAILGVVDIIETEPQCSLTVNGKMVPISPYHALAYVRVNAFGAWCLDSRDSRPETAKHEFETITDDELLLVTFRGHSLERKLFLEQIGQHLGEERYRISETTFVQGCKNVAEITKRVERFKALVDPRPSPRWMAFFDTVESRSLAFALPQACLLYNLPPDPALKKMLMEDPQMRKLVIRAEGNRIVVKVDDRKAFQKLLLKQGFLDLASEVVV